MNHDTYVQHKSHKAERRPWPRANCQCHHASNAPSRWSTSTTTHSRASMKQLWQPCPLQPIDGIVTNDWGQWMPLSVKGIMGLIESLILPSVKGHRIVPDKPACHAMAPQTNRKRHRGSLRANTKPPWASEDPMTQRSKGAMWPSHPKIRLQDLASRSDRNPKRNDRQELIPHIKKSLICQTTNHKKIRTTSIDANYHPTSILFMRQISHGGGC